MTKQLGRFDPILAVLTTLLTPILLFLFYAFVWVLPHDLANEKRCLEAGYPKVSTAWDGDGYCMTLDGVVTVQVEKLP